MNPNARKVVELLPRLHERLSDVAHARRARMNQLGSILMAYALEHIDEALSDSDRLLQDYEGPIKPPPGTVPRR